MLEKMEEQSSIFHVGSILSFLEEQVLQACFDGAIKEQGIKAR